MRGAQAEFWTRVQSGIEVAVGAADPEKLLGVRDGFLQYFHDGLERPVPVSVVSVPDGDDERYVPLSDAEILGRARQRVHDLRASLGSAYLFYACSEAGLHTIEVGDRTLHFVRNWTVVCGPFGEAHGGSGSLQLPVSLIEGLDADQVPFAIPGTRRRGGMASSLTSGLVTRRSTIAVSTLNAVSTLLYGVLESRPVRRRPG